MEMTKEDTNKVIFAEIASRLTNYHLVLRHSKVYFKRFREFDGMKEQHSKLLQQLDQMRNELTNFINEHCRHEVINNVIR